MLNSKKNDIRFICFVLVIILALLSLLQIFVFCDFAIAETQSSEVQEFEISNVEKIISAMPSPSPMMTLSKDNTVNTVDKYRAIRDVDGVEKYLYVEFTQGGYAIYDRQGEFLHERSAIGNGPYSIYLDNNTVELYYAGPANYYKKAGSEYEHILLGDNMSTESFEELSNDLNSTRQEYLNGNLNTLSVKSLDNLKSNETFYLAQEMVSFDEDIPTEAASYYIARAFAYEQNCPTFNGEYYIQKNEIVVYDSPYTSSQVDAFFGLNKYNSCTFVALASVIQYYNNVCKEKMMPNNISEFTLKYDYDVIIHDDAFSEQAGWLPGLKSYKEKLSLTDKNFLVAEFLHQDLICAQFGYDTVSTGDFGHYTNQLGVVYNNYASHHKLQSNNNYEYHDIILDGLAKAVVDGNPCIISIKKGTVRPDGVSSDKNHAAVTYGFTGTKTLGYSFDTVICDYGWYNDPAFTCAEINKNDINGYGYFDIY